MISDVACEPELPPELMIRGTKSASTTACAISPSKWLIAVAVSISPKNSAVSHPPRFLIIGQKRIEMYGSSSASIPPSFWMSSVCTSSRISITSSTVTTPMMCPLSLTTGTAMRSYVAVVRATS